MTFGERLTQLCEDKNISQRKLAQLLGVSHSMINRFATGITEPKTNQIIIIAEILGVTTDYLLGVTEIPGTDKWVEQYLESQISMLSKSEDYAKQHEATSAKYWLNKIRNDIKEKK